MGSLIKTIALLVGIFCGLTVLVMGFRYTQEMWSTFWAIVCSLIFPFQIYIVPIIAVIRDSDWTMAIISYGGSATYGILYKLGVGLRSEF